MTTNNEQELKNFLIGQHEKVGTRAICKVCNEQGRDIALDNPKYTKETCCKDMKCVYYETKVPCDGNIKLTCLFAFCQDMMKRNVEFSNYLQKIKEGISEPYKLTFPLEIEEFENDS